MRKRFTEQQIVGVLKEVAAGAKTGELAEQHRRYGHIRLYMLLRREGLMVNHKRTERLYRQEGLRIHRRRKFRTLSVVDTFFENTNSGVMMGRYSSGTSITRGYRKRMRKGLQFRSFLRLL